MPEILHGSLSLSLFLSHIVFRKGKKVSLPPSLSLLRQGMGGGLSPPATRAPHLLWGFEEA